MPVSSAGAGGRSGHWQRLAKEPRALLVADRALGLLLPPKQTPLVTSPIFLNAGLVVLLLDPG